MCEALADQFAKAHASQIDWEGAAAYAIYEIAPAPETVLIEFLKAKAAPVQGLTLKVYGGALLVDGVEAREVLLWHDTVPAQVAVQVRREAGKNPTLKFWNVWRGSVGGSDVTQAWLGNSGMRIEPSEDGRSLSLRCSDGEGAVDFNDLDVRVTVG